MQMWLNDKRSHGDKRLYGKYIIHINDTYLYIFIYYIMLIYTVYSRHSARFRIQWSSDTSATIYSEQILTS